MDNYSEYNTQMGTWVKVYLIINELSINAPPKNPSRIFKNLIGFLNIGLIWADTENWNNIK